MQASLLLLLGSGILLAQSPGALIDRLQQECMEARDSGHFAEAEAKREKARSLLDKMPSNSTEFSLRVLTVARLYSLGNRITPVLTSWNWPSSTFGASRACFHLHPLPTAHPGWIWLHSGCPNGIHSTRRYDGQPPRPGSTPSRSSKGRHLFLHPRHR